jgi:hypothetical protein
MVSHATTHAESHFLVFAGTDGKHGTECVVVVVNGATAFCSGNNGIAAGPGTRESVPGEPKDATSGPTEWVPDEVRKQRVEPVACTATHGNGVQEPRAVQRVQPTH